MRLGARSEECGGDACGCGQDNTLPAKDVGRPIRGTSVSIVDSAGRRVPIGVPGEIHLGGVAVADGYWRRPELTARQFLPGPWYRTGDQGRWTPEGHLQFLGRIAVVIARRGIRLLRKPRCGIAAV